MFSTYFFVSASIASFSASMSFACAPRGAATKPFTTDSRGASSTLPSASVTAMKGMSAATEAGSAMKLILGGVWYRARKKRHRV